MPRRSIITLTSPLSSYMSKLPAMVYLHCRNSFFKVVLSSLFLLPYCLIGKKRKCVTIFFFSKIPGNIKFEFDFGKVVVMQCDI